jgi:cold shock CspA family protein
MIGFVSLFLPDKHFGFVVFSSQQGDDDRVFDRAAHFVDSELQTFVERGDRVEFDLDETNPGRMEALSIRMVDDCVTGTVANHGSKFGYCFLEIDGRYGEGQRVFCAFDDVVPDSIGRRALPIGAPMSCRVVARGGRERAVDVRNEDPALQTLDPETYREYGQVEVFNGDWGHIRRKNGDTLGFLRKNIVTEGVETVAPGTWLKYGITMRPFCFRKDLCEFRHQIFARDICICLDEQSRSQGEPVSRADEPELHFAPGSAEGFFLHAPELPADELKVEPFRKTGEIFTPVERQMTLRQLIELKKLKAA